MFGDLDWPPNASRRFVSISWASCSLLFYLIAKRLFFLYKLLGIWFHSIFVYNSTVFLSFRPYESRGLYYRSKRKTRRPVTMADMTVYEGSSVCCYCGLLFSCFSHAVRLHHFYNENAIINLYHYVVNLMPMCKIITSNYLLSKKLATIVSNYIFLKTILLSRFSMRYSMHSDINMAFFGPSVYLPDTGIVLKRLYIVKLFSPSGRTITWVFWAQPMLHNFDCKIFNGSK